MQLRVDDQKVNIIDTINRESESETCFWNESAKETDLETKKERNGNYEIDLKSDESRKEEVVNSEVHKVKVKWSKERQNKLYWEYRKRSKRTQVKHQKSA